jgi:hypothetical protein
LFGILNIRKYIIPEIVPVLAFRWWEDEPTFLGSLETVNFNNWRSDALSMGPNIEGVSFLSHEDGDSSRFRNVVFYII